MERHQKRNPLFSPVCLSLLTTGFVFLLAPSNALAGLDEDLLVIRHSTDTKSADLKYQELLDKGVAANARLKDGTPILAIAAWWGLPESVKILLERGADIESRHCPSHDSNCWSMTPLMFAAGGKSSETVKILLDRGARIDARLPNGDTALMRAAQAGNTGAVELLLDRTLKTGHNVDMTAILKAATQKAWMRSKYDTVKFLLDRGADVRSIDAALNSAAINGDTDTVRLLLSHGPTVTAKNAALVAAADSFPLDALEKVRIFLAAGTDVNAGGDKVPHTTPLHAAASRGNLELAKFLIDQGAKLDPMDFLRTTPIMQAASDGSTETVKFLLDIEPKNQQLDAASAALPPAAGQGMLAVMNLLFDRGVSTEAIQKSLDAAARGSDIPTMNLLIAHGVDKKAYGEALLYIMLPKIRTVC